MSATLLRTKIKPTILNGTRDFLPRAMLQRTAVMETMRQTFVQFGYAPIETPIISPVETIVGKYGAEGDRLTYTFTDRGGRRIALPYDLTVPFARFVAAHYRDLPMPFKRFQMQRVWRAERPQRGRLREFYQCDIDVVGTSSLMAEAEIVKIIGLIFERLGVRDVVVKVNSRRLLNAILTAYGVVTTAAVSVLRSVDKLAKLGAQVVLEELRALGIKTPERLLGMLQPAADNRLTLRKLARYGTQDLDEFFGYIAALNVSPELLRIDPTLARGLDYYTGLIFEVVAGTDTNALAAGGRYDNLCGLFSDKNFSGVGVAFGFERIMALLEQRRALPNAAPPARVLVTLFDELSAVDALRIYSQLVAANVPAEIYFSPDTLAKQCAFADQKGIPFVLIQGPTERANGAVTIKRLASGKQKILPLQQLVAYIANFYEAN